MKLTVINDRLLAISRLWLGR